MQEFSTKALVLSVRMTGEADAGVSLFTEKEGLIIARAKSLFKSNSKLAGHLQPLMLSEVRLVEKRGIQIVDALMIRSLLQSKSSALVQLAVCELIERLTSPREEDKELWQLILEGSLPSIATLRILGFDPAHARCERCQKSKNLHFDIQRTSYYCSSCIGSAPSSRGIVQV